MALTLLYHHAQLWGCATRRTSSKSRLCVVCFLQLQFIGQCYLRRTTLTLMHARFSIVLSGLVHIRAPASTLAPSASEVWIQGGRNGLIIATDTSSRSRHGHFTEFPSDTATVLVQIPMANGVIPDHDVLHVGPCGWEEMI